MGHSDDEYEEEEVIVLAELNGLVDDELLRKVCTYQFVGLENEKPVLQLGKYNFLGDYEDQMGSALFLQQTVDGDGRKSWSKLCFSDKKLAMQRVFLRKKGEEPADPLSAPDQRPTPVTESGVVTAEDAAPRAGAERPPLTAELSDSEDVPAAERAAAPDEVAPEAGGPAAAPEAASEQ